MSRSQVGMSALDGAVRALRFALLDNPHCSQGLLARQRVVTMEAGPITGQAELLALLCSPAGPRDAYWWLHLSGDAPCLGRVLYSTEPLDGSTPSEILRSFAKRLPGASCGSIAVAQMRWFDAFEQASEQALHWVARFQRRADAAQSAAALRSALRAGTVVRIKDYWELRSGEES